MAKKYDIIERLRAKNERPFIVLDEEHCFTVNTSKTNVMAIMAKADAVKSDSNNDVKLIDEVIEMALGKEALKYIISLDLSMESSMYIVDVIMSAINGEELKEDKQQKK